MNKNEFISAVAERSGYSKKESEAVVSATLGVIQDAMKAGERITFTGFGFFETKTRAERICKNLHTGEPVHVPATRVPFFKPSATLKKAVQGK